METSMRTLVKAMTWQVSGLVAMTLLSYLYTGSWKNAGSLAISSALLGLLIFFIHEKIWQRVSWGRCQ